MVKALIWAGFPSSGETDIVETSLEEVGRVLEHVGM
jgi:hypothetical protein